MTKREDDAMTAANLTHDDAHDITDVLTEAELSFMATIMSAKGKSDQEIALFLAQQGASTDSLPALLHQGTQQKTVEFRKAGQLRMLLGAFLIAVAGLLFFMQSNQITNIGLLFASVTFGLLGVFAFVKGLVRAIFTK